MSILLKIAMYGRGLVSLIMFNFQRKQVCSLVLRKINPQLAAKAFATAAAVAAVTVATASPASAAATSVAWGSSMSQAQFSAQSQCFNWGYQNASNASYSWDDSRNKWKATVQCW